MDANNTLADEMKIQADERTALTRANHTLADEKSTPKFNKKLLAAGLALVTVGVVMARSSKCNRFCKFLARRIAFTGSSQFVKAFFA